MALQKYFDKFLSNIEPSPSTVSYISRIQNSLRSYLKNHEEYGLIFEDSFLSGSYAKHTAIRPTSNDKKRDVDIIVVTNHNKYDNATCVLSELEKTLKENSAYSDTTMQHHSVGVKMSGISIDVVPVIVDEETEELYLIGDSENGTWELTDPKGHKKWSTNVNQDNSNKYKPLVKIFKWWRNTNCPDDTKYPKGITLEKIIADNLGDASLTTEDLFIETIQNIVGAYKEEYIDKGRMPVIDDPSENIIGNDLMSDYDINDFSDFISKLIRHIDLLNDEGTENDTWIKILGNEFPKDTSNKNSLTIAKSFSLLPYKQKPIWVMKKHGFAFVSLKVYNSNGERISYSNNDLPLPKYCTLNFSVITNIKNHFRLFGKLLIRVKRQDRTIHCVEIFIMLNQMKPHGLSIHNIRVRILHNALLLKTTCASRLVKNS